MRVFVVVPDYGYEGMGVPIGAYSTMEKAEEVQSKHASDYFEVDIFEYSVDDVEEVDDDVEEVY